MKKKISFVILFVFIVQSVIVPMPLSAQMNSPFLGESAFIPSSEVYV